MPMLHPEHYCSQRRVRGQSYWLSFLCKTLSFSISSRFIPALSLTPSSNPCPRFIPTIHANQAENVTMRGPTPSMSSVHTVDKQRECSLKSLSAPGGCGSHGNIFCKTTILCYHARTDPVHVRSSSFCSCWSKAFSMFQRRRRHWLSAPGDSVI